MNFQAWLRKHKIDPFEDVTLMSVGTDGISKKDHSLMSVSLARGDTLKTLYVDGACPELAVKYNEIGVEYYNRHKQDPEIVEEEMKYIMKDSPLIITYKSNFTIPWICTLFPFIQDTPVLDILNLISFQDAEYTIPVEIKNTGKLVEYISGECLTLPNQYFNRTVSRMVEMEYDLPELEKRIHQLKDIYQISLQR